MGSAVHPGEWLQRAFLDEYGVSQTALARAMGVSPRRINEIILGRRAITGETALLLEQATGYSAQQWMAFQAEYDLERARAAGGPAAAKDRSPVAVGRADRRARFAFKP